MIKKILIIYAIGAVCAFVVMKFLLRGAISKEDEREFAYYECDYCDYEYSRIVFGILQTVISALFSVLWPFIPVFAAAFYIYDWISDRFPELMGNLSDEKEDADSD